MSKEEQKKIMKKVKIYYNQFYSFLNDYENSIENKINILENIRLKDLHFSINLLIETSLSRLYFNHGLEIFNKFSYVRSQALFNHSKTYALRCLEKNEFLSTEAFIDLNDIEESANFYINSTKIQLIIIQADKDYKKAIEDDVLDMDLLKIPLDLYREAYMLTQISKENKNTSDIEAEAIICSKLSVIFYKILKNIDKAEIYSNLGIQLAMSIPFKNYEREAWFKNAKEIKNEIRNIREKEEREKFSEEREKYKKELEEDFKKISEASKKDAEEFLKFLIDKYPHKPGHTYDVKGEVEKNNMRKVLKDFSAFYHPDKFPSETELKKKVLMEEISKHVNNMYNYYK